MASPVIGSVILVELAPRQFRTRLTASAHRYAVSIPTKNFAIAFGTLAAAERSTSCRLARALRVRPAPFTLSALEALGGLTRSHRAWKNLVLEQVCLTIVNYPGGHLGCISLFEPCVLHTFSPRYGDSATGWPPALTKSRERIGGNAEARLRVLRKV
jgi:hypothetical protein